MPDTPYPALCGTTRVTVLAVDNDAHANWGGPVAAIQHANGRLQLVRLSDLTPVHTRESLIAEAVEDIRAPFTSHSKTAHILNTLADALLALPKEES
jgi:hypothetical protein